MDKSFICQLNYSTLIVFKAVHLFSLKGLLHAFVHIWQIQYPLITRPPKWNREFIFLKEFWINNLKHNNQLKSILTFYWILLLPKVGG